MATLLQISDTHFGTEQAPVCEALRALSREKQPDVLVFSGDLTQRAKAAEFAAARAYVDSLGIAKVLVLPGNHDIPLYNVFARVLHPYRGYAREFGNDLSPVIDTASMLVIGVNTTRASRHKNGVVSQEQIDDVCKKLAGARPGQLRVVVTHQPAAVFRDKDEHDRLRGADAALQAWSAAGADVVLGGHIHLPYVVDLLSGTKAVPNAMWCVQAGTALSSRVRHGTANSVNLIHWECTDSEERTCSVERCDFDVVSGRFMTASRRELALSSVTKRLSSRT